jgi:hypothetical protein
MRFDDQLALVGTTDRALGPATARALTSLGATLMHADDLVRENRSPDVVACCVPFANAATTADYVLLQQAWRLMERAGGGSIVLIASPLGTVWEAGAWGLLGALADHGLRVGIRVNAVEPDGPVELVLALAHRSCPLNGEVVTERDGVVALTIVAETDGYLSAALTPEELRAHWGEVMAARSWHRVRDSKSHITEFFHHVPGWDEATST